MPVGRRLIPGVLAGALALGACSSEQSSDPPPTVATTVPPRTTLPPTTTIAPTTTAAPATTTTTIPPPSTVPPPGPPVGNRVDLFIGGSEPDVGWLALGNWSGAEWDDGATTPASGAPVRVASRAIGVADAAFGASASSCVGGATGPTVALDRPAVEPPGSGYGYIAVPGEWPLHPRPAAVVDFEFPPYRELAEQLLADEPVDPSDGRFGEFILADLDADGTEEAIFVFEHVQDSAGRGTPGDFSMLVLVDTTSATPFPIFTSVVPPLPPPTTDPETSSTVPQVPEVLERARVLDVADLNGDGRMELITRTWAFEGAGAIVTTYRDRTPDEVLTASCGT